jgi:putative sigma-54 modulation protein
MKCSVTFRHMKPSETIREYVDEKIGKVGKLLDKGGEAHVVLSVERHNHLATIELITDGALRIRAEEKSEDMYGSIDEAVEKINTQVKRYRTRLRDLHRDSPGRGRELPHQILRLNKTGEDDGVEKPQVVRQETLVAREMNVDDAVLQMDLLGSEFLVFTDIITHHLNVMYRLPDGQYGLIDARPPA